MRSDALPSLEQCETESNKLRSLLEQTQHQLEASRVATEKESAAMQASLAEVLCYWCYRTNSHLGEAALATPRFAAAGADPSRTGPR